MPSKESIMCQKKQMILNLQRELSALEKIETGRLYHLQDHGHYGYIETFNKETARFQVVVSKDTRLSDTNYSRHRHNILMVDYPVLGQALRVKKQDLPLLIGMPFVSVKFEQILKGRTRIKMD